jgi:hypothetical protein
VSPNATNPYTQEYNLNFQYALAKDYLVEVGYVGAHTTHMAESLATATSAT